MPKKVTIAIAFPSPMTDADCTSQYLVEWKKSTDTNYNSELQVNPDEIILNNLTDDVLYNVRLTRYCCGGLVSEPTTFNIDTSTTSP